MDNIVVNLLPLTTVQDADPPAPLPLGAVFI
jgi:hypothetical protein